MKKFIVFMFFASFAAGEYHAVVPFKDASKCLNFDYSKHEDLKPNLQRFIK